MNRSYIIAGLSLITASSASTLHARADSSVAPQKQTTSIASLATVQPDAGIKKRLNLEGLDLQGAVEVSPQHIPSDLMAWWLDPKHNYRPSYVMEESVACLSERRGGSVLGPWSSANTKPLVAGIDFVVPDAGNSRLIVKGTQAGMDTLLEYMKRLDKPLQSVNIDVQVADLSLNDIDSVALPSPIIQGPFKLGTTSYYSRIPREDFRLQLQRLVKDKRAVSLYSDEEEVCRGEIARFARVTMPLGIFDEVGNSLEIRMSVLAGQGALTDQNDGIAYTMWFNSMVGMSTPEAKEETLMFLLLTPNNSRAITIFITPHCVQGGPTTVNH